MAISTFSELKTAVANWLNRSDLTDRIPEFIALAEARMNRDDRLRTVDCISRGTLSVSSQFTALPSDFARMVNLEYQGDTVGVMEPLTPQQMDSVRAGDPTGNPLYYCVVNSELEVLPVQSEAVTLGITYYARIASLSDATSSNWLLAAAPDIYLYATLAESAPFLHEDERLAVWESKYNQLCDAYKVSSEGDQAGGAPLVMRGEAFY